MRRWLSGYKFPDQDMDWTFNTGLNSLEVEPNLKYTLFDEYISQPRCVTDYALVCASVKGWAANNLTVNKMLFFQGDIEDSKDEEGNIISPKGLNAIGSDKFISNMKVKLGKRF